MEEFNKHSRIHSHTLSKRFGSWNEALKKAGLETSKIINISSEELFKEIDQVWNHLGRQPSYREMEELSRFSLKPFEKKFGSWLKALEGFVKWKGSEGTDTKKVNKIIKPELFSQTPRKKISKQRKVEYGEPIDFYGLRHAPLNEQGVVYLFGMLSRELGFIIEAIRTDFPDCEGKREILNKPGRWENVSIEFEFKSSNFLVHGHDPSECDIIVCWENDWKDCPIEVLSLREIMEKKKF